MVVRIHNVGKWALLPIGKVIELSGGDRRKVRLQVNTEMPTRLDVWERGADDPETGEETSRQTFLAVVNGLETVEFTASAQVHVTADSEGEVWYFTDNVSDAEAQAEAAAAVQGVSFAKIMQRRARNPQMELMQWKLEENINRRLALQAAEFERRMAELQAATPHDPETGEVIDDEDGVGATDGAVSGDQGDPSGAGAASDAGQGAGAKPGAGIPA